MRACEFEINVNRRALSGVIRSNFFSHCFQCGSVQVAFSWWKHKVCPAVAGKLSGRLMGGQCPRAARGASRTGANAPSSRASAPRFVSLVWLMRSGCWLNPAREYPFQVFDQVFGVTNQNLMSIEHESLRWLVLMLLVNRFEAGELFRCPVDNNARAHDERREV